MKSIYIPNALLGEKTASGSQEKWYDPKTDRWNKADLFGYEGLAEVLVSALLEKSNIKTQTPFDFVSYTSEKFSIRGLNRAGCSSQCFLGKNQLLVTIDRLFKKFYGKPLEIKLRNFSGISHRIRFVAEKTMEITGLDDFGKYLTMIIEADALFLNTVRTFENICVIYDLNEKKFMYSPVFNNGGGLLSDMLSFPLDEDADYLISECRSKLLDTSFNRQVKAVHSLYGNVLKMPYITAVEVNALLVPLLEYYPASIRPAIMERVQKCISKRQTALQML